MPARCAMLAVAACVAAALPCQVRAGAVEDCVEASTPSRGLEACTQVIESGRYARADLAWAYHNRALSYYNMDMYEESLLDLIQVLSIDPGFRRAYLDRANAKCMLGQGRSAVKDYELALDHDAIDKKVEWQRFLRDQGHYSGAIDGIFGPASRRAMLAWAEASCY